MKTRILIYKFVRVIVSIMLTITPITCIRSPRGEHNMSWVEHRVREEIYIYVYIYRVSSIRSVGLYIIHIEKYDANRSGFSTGGGEFMHAPKPICRKEVAWISQPKEQCLQPKILHREDEMKPILDPHTCFVL